MSQESPRMVTTVNHWSAFPTAVFSGSGIFAPQLYPNQATAEKGQTDNSKHDNIAMAKKTLPLMPVEGQTQKTHIFPKYRVAGRVGIANKDNCNTNKDTTFYSSTNAIIGGGGANNHTKLTTSNKINTSSTTDHSLLTLAGASLQHQQKQYQQKQHQSPRVPLASVMLPEMALAANNNSSNAAEGATRTRRSRAIAIKRPGSSTADASTFGAQDDGEQPVSASAERMYDWATWRMYERITEHRRRHPIKRAYTHESSSSSSSCRKGKYDHDEDELEAEGRDQARDQRLCAGGSCRTLMTPVNGVDEEHFFDGEVFELEI